MVVLTLTDCPPALRGDLSKWLQEINTGVYVGQVSARVRDELWGRVVAHAGRGRATMVFSANNEQRMDFLVHNTSWEPIDFDGLKLMLRPCPARLQATSTLRTGYSNAAKSLMARRASTHRPMPKAEDVVAVDVETTGLDADTCEIIEIGAIKTRNWEIAETYSVLVKPREALSPSITALTGITQDILTQEGQPLQAALSGFLQFVGEIPVVSHNAKFDFAFLRCACAQCGQPLFSNRCIDTLALARRMVKEVADYKLKTLLTHFGIQEDEIHRSIGDCRAVLKLYGKLNEMRGAEK